MADHLSTDVFDYQSKVDELLKYIGSEPRKISLIVHKNPDGDAIGASLALCLWLTKMGHEITIIAPNRYPDCFSWLPNASDILVYGSDLFRETVDGYIDESSLILCIDFCQKQRIDDLADKLSRPNVSVAVIDHHLDEPDIDGYICSNRQAASTCEIIYEMLSKINALDNDIVTCLYVGIVTDTNRFMTSNMSPRVHELSAEILRTYEINVAAVYKSVYGSNTITRLRLLGFVLNRCLKQIPGYNASYIAISRENARRFVINPGDTDGIVNYALSLKNIVFAAMFKEKKDRILISLRSIGDIDVSKIAAEHFNGGGHKNASGGISKLSLEETIKKFDKIVRTLDCLKNNSN